MTSPVDIRPDHLKVVEDILCVHLPSETKIWVFGNRAAWVAKGTSDLDLAIEGKTPFDLKVTSVLQNAFENSELPYTVDVMDINRVSNSFKQIIEAQKIPLSIPKKQAGQRNRSSGKAVQAVA